MPLQNRVLPDGKIVAQPWRGNFMGNKGGRIHDPETRTLLKRKWASKRWIICVTEFKNRQRTVMGEGYTELFFLDEVSALASGHRPCFECRRIDANAFADAWAKVHGKPEGSFADGMDKQLHQERTGVKSVLTLNDVEELPDAAMVSNGVDFFAKKDGKFLQWSDKGYKKTNLKAREYTLLTPPSIIGVLRENFLPSWHTTAQGLIHGSA